MANSTQFANANVAPSLLEEAPKDFYITPVSTAKDLEDVIELVYDYANWLAIDLTFQGFDAEMLAMPGKYGPPSGELLLARHGATNEPMGCVGLRPLVDDVCEMKRLWVRDSARGTSVGRELVGEAIKAGKRLEYRRMRLDTLPRMAAAMKMYRTFGFVDIEPYYDTPQAGTRFLELELM
ncbi:MAG: hypothetical protein Q9160_004489 [Pyrenula sp. 1 TL-2023]